MKKYLIYAPPYDELSGGAVCLHYLCHLLNENGFDASLVPFFDEKYIGRRGSIAKLKAWYKELKRIRSPFGTYQLFNTPVVKHFHDLASREDCCVVYPEVVNGNPLGAKNVVRWLLHNPGFHTGNFEYGAEEIYFKFNDAIKDFYYPGSVLAKSGLKVIRYPLEHYNMHGVSNVRNGIAYCLRKGATKARQEDLSTWSLIDNLTHAEVAQIFKKVKTFYSYDTLTAYSIFAVLCGCDSVVIPDEGVAEDVWYPNPADRYGIAYGVENIEKARGTQHFVLKRVLAEHEKNAENVMAFTREVDAYFNADRLLQIN